MAGTSSPSEPFDRLGSAFTMLEWSKGPQPKQCCLAEQLTNSLSHSSPHPYRPCITCPVSEVVPTRQWHTSPCLRSVPSNSCLSLALCTGSVWHPFCQSLTQHTSIRLSCQARPSFTVGSRDIVIIASGARWSKMVRQIVSSSQMRPTLGGPWSSRPRVWRTRLASQPTQ